MTPSPAPPPLSTLAIWSRYLLLALAVLFVAGAMGQFFLAGLAVFDSPLRWSDHRNLGHTLDLVAMVIWIPAALGRVGWRLVAGSVLLVVLFKAQYAFVEIDEPYVRALHPLNGAVLFALSLWIVRRALDLVRRPRRSRDNGRGRTAPPRP